MSRISFLFTLCSALFVLTLTAPTAPAFEMKAGVAKCVITNETPLVTVNGPVSTGVVTDIHARALVLNDGEKRLVILTYDLNCLDVATPYLRVRVRDELGIDPSRLIPLATHNHNAPIQINPDNFAYGRWLANRMFDLIVEAIEKEAGPAKAEFGFGDGYFIYSKGNSPTDYEIQLLKVSVANKPIAFLFNHGTHPMQASISKIGAGHPGYAMMEIEEKFPGVQAMYADACGGNQFPILPKGFVIERLDAQLAGLKDPDSLLEPHCKEIGHKLAEAVFKILEGPFEDVTGPISSRMDRLSLPLGKPISKEEAQKLVKEVPKDVGFVPYPHPNRDTNWVRMLLRYYEKGLPFPTETADMICTDDTYLIRKDDKEFLDRYESAIHDELPCEYEEVIVAKIGPMPLVAMQGEVCAPIGMRVKDAFRQKGPIMVFGYMGEHNLYIPTREIVRLKAYQSRVIQIQYASPVPWAPEVEDEMVAGVVKSVRKLMDGEE